MTEPEWMDEAGEYWPDVLALHILGLPRVAPKEHATQERNPLLPRDFTLPRIEDEDD